jgi:hypothetical protein
MSVERELNGSCHCGNVLFVLHTNKTENDFTPRTCQCTLCRRHDASWISDPEGTAEVTYSDKQNVSFYRFGTETADFIICKNCGVLMVATCEIEGAKRAVLNIKSMLGHSFTKAPILTNFDGEKVEGRLDRRKQNWTGRVAVAGRA